MTNEKPLYFPALDGLRFCAFALVFVHHLPRSEFAPLGFIHDHGWVGVHIFLFLSAYLLTTILRAEQAARGTISIGRFLGRRLLRIWPLYFAFCGLAVAWALHHRSYQANDLPHIVGLATFTENWVSGAVGYSTVPYTAHLWTIALEEQFYLLLPWLLASWLAARTLRRLRSGLVVLWLVFVLARTLAVALAASHPWIWTSLFCADSLIIGTWLGAESHPISAPRTRAICMFAGIVALASPGLLPPIEEVGWHQVAVYVLVAAGAAMVGIASIDSITLRPLLANAIARYLGKISYGLYVFHLVAIEVADKVTHRLWHGAPPWIAVAALALAITIAIAAASYQLLERPFLRLKRRLEVVATRPI